jgi:hypothetical protein
MTTPEADAAFDRTIARLRRIQVRLLIVGGLVFVLTPLIVGLSVAAGADWMEWFWVVSITVFASGLALTIGTTTAERRRWRKHVLEIARVDLETDEGVHRP